MENTTEEKSIPKEKTFLEQKPHNLQVTLPATPVTSGSTMITAQGSAMTVKRAENIRKKLP